MRTSGVRPIVRWLMIASAIIAIDLAATLWTVVAKTVSPFAVGSGPSRAYRIYYPLIDDSCVVITRDSMTGKTLGRTVIRPATAAGLCRVWWPAVVTGLLTLTGLALASTLGGRRFVAEFPMPRITTRRLMIAVAVMGADLGWVLRMRYSFLVGIFYGRWTPDLVDMLIVHTLAFVAAGVALLFSCVRRRRSPDPPESVTSQV